MLRGDAGLEAREAGREDRVALRGVETEELVLALGLPEEQRLERAPPELGPGGRARGELAERGMAPDEHARRLVRHDEGARGSAREEIGERARELAFGDEGLRALGTVREGEVLAQEAADDDGDLARDDAGAEEVLAAGELAGAEESEALPDGGFVHGREAMEGGGEGREVGVGRAIRRSPGARHGHGCYRAPRLVRPQQKVPPTSFRPPFGGGPERRIGLDSTGPGGRSVPISGMFGQPMGTRKQQSAEGEPSMSPSGDALALPPTPRAPGMDSWKQVRIRVSDADRRKVGETAGPPPRKPPKRRPYDPEACLATLRRWRTMLDEPVRDPRKLLGIDSGTSREEALVYWSIVADPLLRVGSARREKLDETIAAFGSAPLAFEPPSFDGIEQASELECLVVLAAFGVEGLAALFAALPAGLRVVPYDSVQSSVLRHLSEEERTDLRTRLRASMDTTGPIDWKLVLLGWLGEPPEGIAAYVSKWPDGSGRSQGASPSASAHASGNLVLHALFGLRDPDRIAHEARRLGAWPLTPEDARLLYAATEARCVSLVAEAALHASWKSDAKAMAKTLLLVEAPETARAMLALRASPHTRELAEEWLRANPERTALGLVAAAAENGADASAAFEYVCGLVRGGETALVEDALASVGGEAAETVRKKLSASMARELPEAKPSELPEWVRLHFGDESPREAAPVVLEQHRRRPARRVDSTTWTREERLPQVPPPESVGPALPFDLEASLAKLDSVAPRTGGDPTMGPSRPRWDWESLRLSLPMTREEALFWLRAFDEAQRGRTVEDVKRSATSERLDEARPLAWLEQKHARSIPVPLYVLHGFEGIAWMADRTDDIVTSVRHVLDSVVRWLDLGVRVELRRFLLSASEAGPGSLLLAERLGATKGELREGISRLRRERHGVPYLPAPLLYTLGDVDEILAEAARLDVKPWVAWQGREWLAATGVVGLGRLALGVADPSADKVALVECIASVEAPEVAPILLGLRKHGACKETVRAWLDAHPVFAIEGLLPLVGTNDKLARAAVEVLNGARRRGFGPLIAELARGDASIAALVLDESVDRSRPTASDKALARTLPSIAIDTEVGLRALGVDVVAHVVADLRDSTLDEPSPRLEVLRENADRASLDRFAWALFEAWSNDGMRSKEGWRLLALGHLGGDASALGLGKAVRTWARDKQHARAAIGIECLEAIGTDMAVMVLHDLEQTAPTLGMRDRAYHGLERIALARGLGREQLADRMIPTCGLEDGGTHTFSFGARSFTFVLGAGLEPMVRNAEGKLATDLPKPGAKDDAVAAKAAIEEWKLLKKQVVEVAKAQTSRLELAMVLGRRWTPDELVSLFLGHPLMKLLVRRLIWSAHDTSGDRLFVFRIGEDDTFSNGEDEACTLGPDVASVGILHPAEIDEGERRSLRSLLADYDIVPPFPQLDRRVYPSSDPANPDPAPDRLGDRTIDPKALIFGLEARDWRRGPPDDGYALTSHVKTFGDVEAVVRYSPGVVIGGFQEDWDPQTLEDLSFRPRSRRDDADPERSSERDASASLSAVPARVRSEAMVDLLRLYEKGTTKA